MGHVHDIPVNTHANGANAVIEVELNDGRTVQLYINEEGDFCIRGWGNVPAKIGNMNRITLACHIEHEPQTTCSICYGRLGGCTCEHEADS